jgi:predicted MFS family arabinose efflux permease
MVASPPMPLLLLIGAFLEGIALTLIQGYLPLYVRRALGEAHYVTVGLVIAVPALGTAIGSNFWGGLSDVTGRLKPMLLLGMAGYTIALLGIPALRDGLGVLVFIAMASLLYGTLGPTLKAYATLARPDRIEHAIAHIVLAYSTGWLVGSYGGGWLIERDLASGLRVAMWSCAALTLLNAALIGAFVPDQVRDRAPARRVMERRGILAGVLADLSALYGNPRLFRLCVIAFFVVAGNYLMWGFFTVFMVEHVGGSIGAVRNALVASSIVGMASLPFVGPVVRRIGGPLALAIGISVYLVMYLVMALFRDQLVVSAIYALPLYGLVNVSANALAARYASVDQRGGGLGVMQGAYALATVAGPLTGGWIADRVGLGAVPWASFAFTAIACPLAWMACRGAASGSTGDPAAEGLPRAIAPDSGRNAR